MQDFKAALFNYDNAINLNLKIAELYNDKGIALMELKDWPNALRSFNNALSINSYFYKSHYNKGSVLLKLKEYKLAILESM